MEFSPLYHLTIKNLKIMKTSMIVILMIVLGSWTNRLVEMKTIKGTVYSGDNGNVLKGVLVQVKNSTKQAYSDKSGAYSISVPGAESILVFSLSGFISQEMNVKGRSIIDAYLYSQVKKEHKVITDKRIKGNYRQANMPSLMESSAYDMSSGAGYYHESEAYPSFNTEEYSSIVENIFHDPTRIPLSTFSIDVDAASYSNIRRFINSSQLPPTDAVRIEEMINYFNYDYSQPSKEDPFSINTEVGICPWNEKHYLVHLGLQGKQIPMDDLPPSNLVFLLDVSGSMNQANKLPLLKSAFKMLVANLRAEDKVSIVVYAGAAGMVLSPTSGDKKGTIIAALEQLQAGGSTAGGQGIRLAYKIARQNFKNNGNNRIILATDGDFNIGESSNAAMERLIEEERNSGVFLTVLGFGMGNYKDSKMEVLADKGNGNYAYIDTILEAKKVLVNEFGGTLFTIAKDVKIQVEFNPEVVQAYRLIGYENRKLKDEDFNDDKKDAGELGSGHTVTALYEIIPVGVEDEFTGSIDPLKYQKAPKSNQKFGSEMMAVKLRYKEPNGESSKLLSETIRHKVSQYDGTSDNFKFSASVAAFGMLLRDSEFKGTASYEKVLEWANASRGSDLEGYRAEMIDLVEASGLLTNS